MASAASGQGRILTKGDLEAYAKESGWKRKGGDVNLHQWLGEQLASGAAASPGLVKAWNNGKYDTAHQSMMRASTGDPSWGLDQQSPANVRGMSGLSLSPGQLYLGSSTQKITTKSTRTPNGGVKPSRSETRVSPILTTVGQFRGATQAPAQAAPQEAKQPLEPDQGLLDARQRYREALDRAKTYTEQGGSAASYAYDSPLSKSGPDLYAGIDKQAREEIAQYTKRFPEFWDAKANLTAQEIGFASREAINQLSADLNLPDYTSIFPDSGAAADKIDEKGLYGWLSNQKRLG